MRIQEEHVGFYMWADSDRDYDNNLNGFDEFGFSSPFDIKVVCMIQINWNYTYSHVF